MSATLVQSKQKALTSGSSVSLTLDAPTTVGSVLVVATGVTSGALSGGGVTSWQPMATNGSAVNVWWGLVASASDTITISALGRSGSVAFQVAEFSGVDFAASGAAIEAGASGTSTTPNSGNATTSARSLFVGAIAAAAAWSSGFAGWTQFAEIAAQAGQILRVAYRVEDAGAYAASGTLSTSAGWGAAILAMTETAGGGSSSRNPSSLGMLGVG